MMFMSLILTLGYTNFAFANSYTLDLSAHTLYTVGFYEAQIPESSNIENRYL